MRGRLHCPCHVAEGECLPDIGKIDDHDVAE
jgi:hypothetical protein